VHEVTRVLLYGLLAAASPVTLMATLVVLASGRGRANGAAFAAAFVMGQTAAFVVALIIGSALNEQSHTDATALLELTAGVALLVIAFVKRPPHEPRTESSARAEALFARLSGLRPAIAFGFGVPLGVGAKRLLITILAASAVALAELAPAEDVGLTVLYVAVSTLVVTIPVSLYVIFGERADDVMVRSRSWIASNQEFLAFSTALAVGVLLILDGAIRLAA
jgi:Sap, sulfolipid-1-addressing protein